MAVALRRARAGYVRRWGYRVYTAPLRTAPTLRQLTRPASVLLVAAAGAWAGVVVLERDMGPMPGTMGLGAGSFVGVWALMMAAMMLPSMAPFASLYTRSFGPERGQRLAAFASGYLVVWTVAALPAYGVAWLADRLVGHSGTVSWSPARSTWSWWRRPR